MAGLFIYMYVSVKRTLKDNIKVDTSERVLECICQNLILVLAMLKLQVALLDS
jgi:hypothetical protein